MTKVAGQHSAAIFNLIRIDHINVNLRFMFKSRICIRLPPAGFRDRQGIHVRQLTTYWILPESFAQSSELFIMKWLSEGKGGLARPSLLFRLDDLCEFFVVNACSLHIAQCSYAPHFVLQTIRGFRDSPRYATISPAYCEVVVSLPPISNANTRGWMVAICCASPIPLLKPTASPQLFYEKNTFKMLPIVHMTLFTDQIW